MIPFGKPILGREEHEAVSAVLDSGTLAHGPAVTAFEEAFAKFTGAPHAVAVASCTAAMHLTYHKLGLSPGDEVIVPAMTHVATAHAVSYTGAKPVFVDADPQTGNINVEKVAEAITDKTRAIAVVHYLGLPADMQRLSALAREHDLFLLEDCALAIGSRVDGTHAGLLGDIGCFSFYPVKHITTAEGGMIITRDGDLAAAIRKLRAFGMDKHVGERTTPGLYDVGALGYNYRMNEIQAALGVEQMKRLPGFLARRRENYRRLAEGLAKIDGITLLRSERADVQSSHYCMVMLLEGELADKRHEAIHMLKARGVGTSIYYPHPVPRMAYYADTQGYSRDDFPVAERIADTSIALPCGPHVTPDDVEYMIEAVTTVVRELR